MLSSIFHPYEMYAMAKWKLTKDPDAIPEGIESKHLRWSYFMLNKTSRSFAFVIRELSDELRDAVWFILVFHCVVHSFLAFFFFFFQVNNTMMGGKKASYWSEDILNVRYLSGFLWAHLQEEEAYKRAVASSRLRNEMRMAKRENDAYLKRIAKAKEIGAIKDRKTKRGESLQVDQKRNVRQKTAKTLYKESETLVKDLFG